MPLPNRRLEDFARQAAPELSFTNQRPDRAFDLVLLLDVLEHVADDCDLLADVVRDLVRPGGFLVAAFRLARVLHPAR